MKNFSQRSLYVETMLGWTHSSSSGESFRGREKYAGQISQQGQKPCKLNRNHHTQEVGGT